MKYVRTKQGDIGKLDGTEILIDGHWYSKSEIGKHIIKIADTIDELCDRYVGISNNKNNKPMIIKYEFGEYYDEYNDSYTKGELLAMYDVIYGAIYTNKGLIYVVKMNDEGK